MANPVKQNVYKNITWCIDCYVQGLSMKRSSLMVLENYWRSLAGTVVISMLLRSVMSLALWYTGIPCVVMFVRFCQIMQDN